MVHWEYIETLDEETDIFYYETRTIAPSIKRDYLTLRYVISLMLASGFATLVFVLRACMCVRACVCDLNPMKHGVRIPCTLVPTKSL